MLAKFIVCKRGHSDDPRAAHDRCSQCGEEIHSYPISVAKKSEGWKLICAQCFDAFREACGTQGVPIMWGGRIRNNSLVIPAELRCPTCGAMLGAAFPAGKRASPAPGDATVCLDCGEVSVFGPEMKTLVKMTLEQFAGCPEELQLTIEKARLAVQGLRRSMKAHTN